MSSIVQIPKTFTNMVNKTFEDHNRQSTKHSLVNVQVIFPSVRRKYDTLIKTSEPTTNIILYKTLV